MNIQILHSHLLEFLKTKAKPEKIGECLALCGPAVEHVHKKGKNDALYDIEITTNRIDSACVMGVAREAHTILNEFGIKAEFINNNTKLSTHKPGKAIPLAVKIDKKLNKRVMAVVMDVTVGESPKWMKERLEASGIRSPNNLIDITNYVMLEVGHPTHVFDYDKITSHALNFRLSTEGEKITTLDNKTYTLLGGDIVIDDGNEIIDLPGIMGTKNSVVNDETKRIIFFLDNNDPLLMRRTSLSLNIRSIAVQLNEKHVDPELGTIAFARGIELYRQLAKAVVISKVYDFYPKPYVPKMIKISHEEIIAKIGVAIDKAKVKRILQDLGFTTKLTGNKYTVTVPSWRAEDVSIPEDIVEEVARIYGYHNLPSEIMTGPLPLTTHNKQFSFERNVKQTLKGLGGIEVYTLSLVPKSFVGELALRTKNPLGADTEYLRTTLVPSLMEAAKTNKGHHPFHLFEMANVYLPKENDLPEEALHLGGIFVGLSYRDVKGILEALFETFHIESEFEMEDKVVVVKAHEAILGFIEKLPDNKFAYEFSVESLLNNHKEYTRFQPPSKYPAHVEDMTFVLPQGTFVGNVMKVIKKQTHVREVELIDEYHDAFTFRVWYHNPKKTVTDEEATKLREKVIAEVGKKFGAKIKD